MAFERATPPALRWVLVFLGVCAALGLFMGFKDQIRRNPPAWYTGAPDPTVPGAPAGPDGVREATAFDPNARAPVVQAAPAPKKSEEPDEDEADAAATTQTTQPETTATSPTAPTAANPSAPAAPRPRPTPPVARPAPSEDPVGDMIDAPRPAPAQPQPDVPY